MLGPASLCIFLVSALLTWVIRIRAPHCNMLTSDKKLLDQFYSGSSEPFFQLGLELGTSVSTSALPSFNKKLAKSFLARIPHRWYPVKFLIPQVMSDFPGLTSGRILANWFSQKFFLTLIFPLSKFLPTDSLILLLGCKSPLVHIVELSPALYWGSFLLLR